MGVMFDFRDFDRFISLGLEEVRAKEEAICREAVDYAVTNGNYKNRTGNLRASNHARVNGNLSIDIYNDADYASNVEARGYEVASGAALFAETRLKQEIG